MQINHRAYRREEDAPHIREFLSRIYGVTHHPYTFLDPPNWEFIRNDLMREPDRRSIHLWELTEHASKTLVGMVMYERHRAKFSYLVDLHHEDIHNSICDWVEEEHREENSCRGENIALKCSVCEMNKGQKAILTRRGYTKGKLDTVFRKRSMRGVIANTVLPINCCVRDGKELSGELLAERAWIENDTFGRSITVEFLNELQKTIIYRPELDLMITVPDGSIAAFCSIWFDAVNSVGFIEPIGTAAAYRCLGIAKALLNEGFRRLQKLGAVMAYLGNRADNSAGNYLYESVKMPVFDREYLWQKEF